MSGAGEDPRPGQREHLLREDAVQQRGAVDQGHEVHADQPQVGPRLGDQQVHQQGVVTRAVNTFLFSVITQQMIWNMIKVNLTTT